MTIREYQKQSTRTLNPTLNGTEQIINMIMGMNGEVGELTDLFKKNMFQGHELVTERVIEELGDIMFYIVNLCTMLDIKMEDVLDYNVEKLQKRYPDGFDRKRSINREV